MIDWTFLLLIPSILAVVWWLPLQPNRRQQPTDHNYDNSPFHAVSIQCSGKACETALALQHVRILATEASSLPLAQCNENQCQCTYQHFADRRSGTDRRLNQDVYTMSQFQNKRSGSDRRKVNYASQVMSYS